MMRHPFDFTLTELDAIDLDFQENLTDHEASQVGGGLTYTTLAVGEEGGSSRPYPIPHPRPNPRPSEPPTMTTLALGEEGGDPGWTKALHETGGDVTTYAVGEEGGTAAY